MTLLRTVRRAAAALAAFAAATLPPSPAAAQAPPIELTQAEAVPLTSDGRANESMVRRTPLPHRWDADWPGPGGRALYRLHFDEPPAGAGLVGLYVERACNTLAVTLNGELIHQGGRLEEPVSRRCHEPQPAVVPRALLRPAGNRIEVTVQGYAPGEVSSPLAAGGLSALRLGDHAALARSHDLRVALGVRLPEVLGGALVLMGGFMFVLGWFHRRQSHLAYFGALVIGWAALESRRWLGDLPWPNRVTELALAALAGPTAMALVQFLLRYAGQRKRWIDRGLPLQCVVLVASLALAGEKHLLAVSSGWHALLAAEALAAVAASLAILGARHPLQAGAMALLFALAGGALAVDALAAWGLLDPRLGVVAPLVPPVIMLALGLWLVQQHELALRSAEHGRAELEVHIREAAAQIERNFTQLAELKIEQVTARERKRIAADLHDDLGAKLLTIVHTSESERISTLAREALEEMRLSVRGLAGKPVRLADAFGDWRAEVVSRLRQAGIEAEWTAPTEDDAPQTLSARAFVQTTRILREAVSNIIKHSGATRCSVSCEIDAGDFLLVVQDDGHGIPIELDGHLDRGHGMASMKGRAKQLQGQCLVESGPGFGTVIRLTLPLNRHVTPP